MNCLCGAMTVSPCSGILCSGSPEPAETALLFPSRIEANLRQGHIMHLVPNITKLLLQRLLRLAFRGSSCRGLVF
ncbi:hypothetical protein BDW62DRAFT_177902 [Aspergillus aurantiobrunneus]